ncbi:hypothetical protein [Streptomyces sp. DT171]|uniref:D-alanyl-D-alanine carboxypeptidase family protein n=1 Tax=Streptomyces sp. DT171 TaxID=3416524 RepID=UPI003CE99BC7
MEEAPVAGESPDKSKQQESSGTTASERDPRLAVFHERSAGAETGNGDRAGRGEAEVEAGNGDRAGSDDRNGSGGRNGKLGADGGRAGGGDGGETGGAGGADGATAVFRVRTSGRDAEALTGSGTSNGTNGAEKGAQGPGKGAGGASEAGAGSGGAGPEEEAADSVAPEEPGGSEAADMKADDVKAADVKATDVKAADVKAADVKAVGDGAGDSDPDRKAGVDADAGSGAESRSGGASHSRDETPAEVRVPKSREETGAEKATGVGEADEVSEPGQAADKPAGDREAVERESDREADDRKANDRKANDRKADASEVEEPETDAPQAEGSKVEGSKAKASGADEPEAGDEPENTPEPDEPAAEEEPTADPDRPSADKPDSGKPDSYRPDSDKPGPDSPKVDQPTAVFKAFRPGEVDQPTTALKISPPGAGASKSREGSGTSKTSKASGTPESPAERTSKFVPLRADDVRPAPAPRKPEASSVPTAAGAAKASAPGAAPEKPAPGKPTAPAKPGAGFPEAERTRQQPMPPRPPLDLLAELTNTPPPPETPVRTAVRRVKIWTPLVLLLLIVFAIVQAVRPLPTPALSMTAQPTYTFDGEKPTLPWPDQGQGYMTATGLGTVDSFGEQKPVPIASVAKAMTAYIVLKDHPLKKGEKGPSIDIDERAEKEGGLDSSENESTLNTVKAGDKLSEYDALAAIMIPSANNIARLLARWDAGSEEAFVKKMNDTAKDLGMKNTVYTDPSGLNATTMSTAEDLVKLGEKLVEIPALMAITKLPEWKDPSGKPWRNWNSLVPYDGALGIKTGTTTKAGGNLLFAAHKMVDGTDQLIVGAVLAQQSSTSIIDAVNSASKKVMIATQKALQGRTIVKKGQVVGAVDDGLGGTTPVVATGDVKAVGWAGLTVKLELSDGGQAVPHSAVAGTHVGTLTVGEGASQVKVAVALQKDLAEPGYGKKLTRIG